MPAALTYPGVYIEEIPSGVRTIAGVATSIAAFLGRAAKGRVDTPVVINNFGDFERAFGGLGVAYPMSYAVRDFFANGGAQAVIVRIYTTPAQGGARTAQIDANGLAVEASSPGSWANGLRVRIDHDVPAPANPGDPHPLPWVDADPNVQGSDLFNLTVRDTRTGAQEVFLNLTAVDSQRRVDRVLAREAALLRATGTGPFTFPTAHDDITDPTLVWTEEAFSSPVSTDGEDSAFLSISSAGDYTGIRANKERLYALEDADLFNILCIPPDQRGADVPAAALSDALNYCVERRAMLIVDPPVAWTSAASAAAGLSSLSLTGVRARNAALYFPRVVMPDPLLEGQPDTFAACGIIAGIWSRTDTARGVWKAPAGLDAALRGVQRLAVKLTDDENGQLNPLGINGLRTFPITGRVVWGARTLRGADQLGDEYKYVPVRRLALFIEESLFRGTQWVVFEPNDEPLWAQIRLNVGAFMRNLFRQGAFQGSSPRDAYFVKVDKETTTQNDVNLGIVNVVVGFAPLKPAEFVVIKIQQMAGQIET
ncbi:MAG: phage tail sheath subtilisin-like domain-containing protein [Kiloniellales bacterium]|nr:phage tail sheath subtilisin-like domain-containing protein [Kiloniellales bacterium]